MSEIFVNDVVNALSFIGDMYISFIVHSGLIVQFLLFFLLPLLLIIHFIRKLIFKRTFKSFTYAPRYNYKTKENEYGELYNKAQLEDSYNHSYSLTKDKKTPYNRSRHLINVKIQLPSSLYGDLKRHAEYMHESVESRIVWILRNSLDIQRR